MASKGRRHAKQAGDTAVSGGTRHAGLRLKPRGSTKACASLLTHIHIVVQGGAVAWRGGAILQWQ